MKGILFTELIEMMEGLVGLELTNKIIEDAQLENKGAFTAIGTYSHKDMNSLLESLGKHVKNPKEILLKSYGEYFFYRASQLYNEKIKMYNDTFSLLLQLHDFLELEIRKLYPQAQVPIVKTTQKSPECLEIFYSSKQNMSLLLEGAILGCIKYFQEQITITREELDNDCSKVRFTLKKHNV